MQRCQRPEFGRNPLRRWRRHDHAVGLVAWRWRAEPVWVVAPRMIPTVVQARRVRVLVTMPVAEDVCWRSGFMEMRGSVKLSGLAREAVDRWTTIFVVGSVKPRTFATAAWT